MRMGTSMSVRLARRTPSSSRRGGATMTDAILPFSTLSISTGSSQTSSRSPGSGIRPISRTMNSPTVKSSVGHAPSTQTRARSSGSSPGSRTRPSLSRSGSSRGALNSSGDAAEQLAEHVLERDHADHGSGRVHDERLVAAPLAQEPEQPIGRHRIRDAQDRPDQARERSAYGRAPESA